MSIGGAALAFFTAYKNLIKAKSVLLINKEKTLAGINIFLNGIKNSNIPSIIKNVITKTDKEKILNIATDKKTINIIAALPAMYVGQIIKENVLKINRIKTKQYKPEFDKETMSKKEIKEIKKTTKKEKKNANFRNGLTGAINGLTLPIVSLLGPIGAPIYAIVNSLSKYFIASREDKGNKSIKSYIENISTSKIINALGALAIAIPLIKKGQFMSVYEKNAQNVVKALENAKLTQTTSFNSIYDNLENILFDNEKIAAIMNLDIDEIEKIRLLSEENIFALKFKQIKNDGTRLTKALKENCPQTWTLEEAQKAVEETFGANKYKLKACVGVGTVAQTFVAQDEKGNDVCIKLIHKGINKEKILKDKEAFIAMINSSTKSQNEKEFLIKNVENIARGVEAEVDLSNEMEAAKKLAKSTKTANVVKPIEVKNNIYVMERADGISLADFNEFGSRFLILKRDVEKSAEIYGTNSKKYQEYKKELDLATAEFKQRIGIDIDFQNLTKKETLEMLKQYQDILSEQFSSADVNGRIIHGDIHPGNIFIDVKKLKEGKNCFTLIDTGNTIEQTKEQALRFINLTNYIKNADVDNITDFVLEGAMLPKGMTRQNAKELISKELNRIFFDKESKLPIMTNDSLLSLTDGIMQKLGIIPSSAQGNLLKARKSGQNSLSELYESYMKKFLSKYTSAKMDSKMQATALIAQVSAELAKDVSNLKFRETIVNLLQQRKNLAKLPPSEKIKLTKGVNIPKENSEQALTYFLKQYSGNDSIADDILNIFDL